MAGYYGIKKVTGGLPVSTTQSSIGRSSQISMRLSAKTNLAKKPAHSKLTSVAENYNQVAQALNTGFTDGFYKDWWTWQPLNQQPWLDNCEVTPRELTELVKNKACFVAGDNCAMVYVSAPKEGKLARIRVFYTPRTQLSAWQALAAKAEKPLRNGDYLNLTPATHLLPAGEVGNASREEGSISGLDTPEEAQFSQPEGKAKKVDGRQLATAGSVH
jgi:hypothetical protein